MSPLKRREGFVRRKAGKKSFRSRRFSCHTCTSRRRLQTRKPSRRLWPDLHCHWRERSYSWYAKSFSLLPSCCSGPGNSICRKSLVTTVRRDYFWGKHGKEWPSLTTPFVLTSRIHIQVDRTEANLCLVTRLHYLWNYFNPLKKPLCFNALRISIF